MKKQCTLDGCEREQLARGLCHRHYEQQRRGKRNQSRLLGQVGAEPVFTCALHGCERERYRRGMCEQHFTEHTQGRFEGALQSVRRLSASETAELFPDKTAGFDFEALVRSLEVGVGYAIPRSEIGPMMTVATWKSYVGRAITTVYGRNEYCMSYAETETEVYVVRRRDALARRRDASAQKQEAAQRRNGEVAQADDADAMREQYRVEWAGKRAALEPLGALLPTNSEGQRVFNCVRRAGLSLDDLRSMSDEQLLQVRGLGVGSLRQIRAVVEALDDASQAHAEDAKQDAEWNAKAAARLSLEPLRPYLNTTLGRKTYMAVWRDGMSLDELRAGPVERVFAIRNLGAKSFEVLRTAMLALEAATPA